MSKWQKISLEEAKQHRLYGVGGWLVVFIVGITLGALAELGEFVRAADEAGLSLRNFTTGQPIVELLIIVAVCNLSILFMLYWLLIFKRPSFRLFAIWMFLVLPYPVTIISLLIFIYPVSPGSGTAEMLIISSIIWIGSCAIWVTYLQRSRRVRVTFEHSIRSNEEREINNEYVWSLAITEFEGDSRHPGLWAKSLAHAKGDESVAKAYYLKQRAIEVLQEQERTNTPSYYTQIITTLVFVLILVIIVGVYNAHSTKNIQNPEKPVVRELTSEELEKPENTFNPLEHTNQQHTKTIHNPEKPVPRELTSEELEKPENTPNPLEHTNQQHTKTIHNPEKSVPRELTSEELEKLTLKITHSILYFTSIVYNGNTNITVTEVAISMYYSEKIKAKSKTYTYSTTISPDTTMEFNEFFNSYGNSLDYKFRIVAAKGYASSQ